MNSLAQDLVQRVDKDRLRESLFQMARVPSPTGQARRFAEHFAGVLATAGASDVPWSRRPATRQRGGGGGAARRRPHPAVQRHLDTSRMSTRSRYLDGDR